MKMVKTKLALGAAVAALALSAGSANAAITFSSVAFDGPLGLHEQIVADFDNPADAGYSVTGGAQTVGNIPNTAAAPSGDATAYYYVTAADSPAELNSTRLLESLSLYIGSIDNYNTISFYNGASFVQAFSGLDFGPPANGDQGLPATNRRVYFDFNGLDVDRVVFTSTQNSFEFDNIAVSAIPEPGVWALMISGFGMLGAALRRRRVGAAVPA